jgi:hypothetical protein
LMMGCTCVAPNEWDREGPSSRPLYPSRLISDDEGTVSYVSVH